MSKGIAFLMVLAFMPSPKVAAQEVSYGIKIAGATSMAYPGQKELEKQYKKDSIKVNLWNPWFGAALYIEYNFNDYIGLGTELLYNRFDRNYESGLDKFLYDMNIDPESLKDAKDAKDAKGLKCKQLLSTHAIGLPVLLIWNCSACIRPDFKEDHFNWRLFWGLHPFICMSQVYQVTVLSQLNSTIVIGDIPFTNDNPRLKFGYIGGTSFEFPNGLLLELKTMFPYNLYNKKNKKGRLDVLCFHLSAGYNLAKLLT